MTTLMEFFVDGTNYYVSYQGILSNEYFIERVENRVKEQF
jgi:hypothetical protein